MEISTTTKPKDYKRNIVLFLFIAFFLFLFRDGSLSVTKDINWFALAGKSFGQIIAITVFSSIFAGFIALILRNKSSFYKFMYVFLWLFGLILFAGLEAAP